MSSLQLPSRLLVPAVETSHLIPSNLSIPFYYTDRPQWYLHMSDKCLALLAPIAIHWSIILLHRLFLFVHCSRGARHSFNKQTVRLMVEIQLVQFLFGCVWLTRFGNKGGTPRDPAEGMQAVGRLLGTILPRLMGNETARLFLHQNGTELIYFAYWWFIPVTRQLLAWFTVDAWQAFLRFLDFDHYLYADVHAFLFDTLGFCLAYSLSGITHREMIIFLVFSTIQTLGPFPRNTVLRNSKLPSPLYPTAPIHLETTVKAGEHASFIAFPRKLRQLARWTVLAVEARFLESRRILRALQATPPPQPSSQSRTRPQLRLNISDTTN